MSDGRGAVREVAWLDICPWLLLLRVFRPAVSARMLLLAALAMVCTSAGWRIIGAVFSSSKDEQLTGVVAPANDVTIPLSATMGVDPRLAELRTSPGLIDLFNQWPWQGMPRPGAGSIDQQVSSFVQQWRLGLRPVHQVLAFGQLFQIRTSYTAMAFLLLCLLWAILVWAFFGGAITRIAALTLTREESPPWQQLLAHSRAKWLSYFAAPLFPFVGIVLATVPIALAGVIVRLNIGLLLAALAWPLVIVGGLFMAVVLVGLAFGWPLMWPTISTEGSDSFDALSRTYAYVYQRPLQYFFFAVVAGVLGLLGWVVVSIFVVAVVYLAAWAISWGSGAERISEVLNGEPAWSLFGAGVGLVAFWHAVVGALALAFIASYFWTAATAIYLLLRQSLDNTELNEVYLEPQDETFGLPPLKEDAAGVPAVTDVPAEKTDKPV